jgi:hypothetical protein
MVRQKKADTVPVEGATITIDVDNFVRYRDRVSRLSFSLHAQPHHDTIVSRNLNGRAELHLDQLQLRQQPCFYHHPPRCRKH